MYIHDIILDDFIFGRNDSCTCLRSVLDNRNKMWTDIHFKIKTTLTAETKMCIVTEQKGAEILHLFNIIRSVIANIQNILQTSSKQRGLLTGLI